MPHLPPSAKLWLERAEIDYIGPFLKAWAAFNAWFRDASGERRDSEGLVYVKSKPNPVRSSIMPLLRPRQTNEHGDPISDSEQAQKFKLLIRDLHVALENYTIEVAREEVSERISFRRVCLSRGVKLPQKTESHGLRYEVNKISGLWRSTVTSSKKPADIRATIEQNRFDVVELQGHENYVCLSINQRATLLGLYNRCDPRPITDLLAGSGDRILVGDIGFHCSDEQLFAALVEIIYAMRNALFHGELQPHEQAFAAYEPAYRIVMRWLECLRS